MNEDLKKRWIEALRSGDYQQYEGGLENEFKDGSMAYCCLGVLKAIDPSVEPDQDESFAFLDPDSCGIPRADQAKLAHYNDGEHEDDRYRQEDDETGEDEHRSLTFVEISNLIESGEVFSHE